MTFKSRLTVIALFILAGLVLTPALSASVRQDQAHDDDTFDIVVEGPVQTINVNIITIANITIQLDDSDPQLPAIQVGDVMKVSGNVDESQGTTILVAQQVVATHANIITPIISINGPVEAVNLNIVTVYGLNIQLNPDDAILQEINTGDIISVNGNIGDFGGVIVVVPVQVVIVVNAPDPEATPEATAEPGTGDEGDDLPVTIVVEGPVQAINVNVITIFNINVQVDPGDPILNEIAVGDTVHVEGNIKTEGDTIIIIAVHITFIQIDVYVAPSNSPVPSNCKVSAKGHHIKCKTSKKKKS